MKQSTSTKSQISIDIIIASIIFLAGIAFFYFYSINYSNEANENINLLYSQGNFILNDVLSEGSPVNWNQTNVQKIGIISDNRINQTKLENFYNLANSNYSKTKAAFNTRFDYYFFLSDNMTSGGAQIQGIGAPINKNTIQSQAVNLIKVTKYTIYNNKPTTAYLYVWET